MNPKQYITGNGNTQVGGNCTINNISFKDTTINLVNLNLSDVRTFEKVLLSIPLENFYKEVIQFYLENHTGLNSEKEILKTLNI
jgi:hypothetical protein